MRLILGIPSRALQYRAGAVQAVGATFDVVAGRSAGAEGVDEFTLDA